MKNLISMTDFVLEQDNIKNDFVDYKRKVINYANFLKQPLELWMFVPCDLDGNVLEEPICQEYALANQKYQQAKERCLFDGFECKHHHSTKKSICTVDNFFHVFWNTNDFWELSKGIFTIEDLVKHNPQLTPTALKKIGL